MVAIYIYRFRLLIGVVNRAMLVSLSTEPGSIGGELVGLMVPRYLSKKNPGAIDTGECCYC